MKVVQIGILAALLVCAGLLYKVYRGEQTPAAPVPAQVTTPTESAQAAPPTTPEAATPAPATAPEPAAGPDRKVEERKPSPSRAAKREVGQAAPPVETPAERAPVPVTPPAQTPAVTPPDSARAPLNPPAGTQTAPPPPRVPHTVTIAAGTMLPVRLSQTLSSDKNQPGEAFSATLDQPLVVDDFIIADRGARVQGRIVEAQKAGRVSGVAALAIQLTSLHTSDGQDIAIQTETFTKEGPTSKAEDAKKVGIGAALGAAIGAIAGGGKGAAIGAGVGGGAGAGTVLATRGKPAQLGVETRIPFRLTEPVTITEKLR
jgi:hypothetical protein